MKILFLGDIVGNSGCEAIKKNLPKIISEKNINFETTSFKKHSCNFFKNKKNISTNNLF